MLSYRPARLHGLAEFIPWNRFLGSINVLKYGLHLYLLLPAFLLLRVLPLLDGLAVADQLASMTLFVAGFLLLLEYVLLLATMLLLAFTPFLASLLLLDSLLQPLFFEFESGNKHFRHRDQILSPDCGM